MPRFLRSASRISLLAAPLFATVTGIFGAFPSPTLAQSLNLAFPPLQFWTPVQVAQTPPAPETKTCATSSHTPSPPQPAWQSSLKQGVAWLDRSQEELFASVQTYGSQLMAYTQASEWPAINDRAKDAKVPVMMYHDILPEKKVSFDVTIAELRQHFELIKKLNLNPISLDQLVDHLYLGAPLPPKPIVLTFDDGYEGHYTQVFPLLKEYGYPATFSVFTDKIDGKIVGRSTLTWAQLQEMAANPLVTIAAHSLSHPPDLTQIPPEQMVQEVQKSKQRLEEKLGIPIHYFTYPEGHYNQAIEAAVTQAGYRAALTMDDFDERYAEQSENLLAISRFGQSRLAEIAPTASGGFQLPPLRFGFDFNSPIEPPEHTTIDGVKLIFIRGGRPTTIHADSRYQVPEILAKTNAIAGVDGAFFNLEYLDSNTLVGPVASQFTHQFIPGNPKENPLLNGRPLVLLSTNAVKFIPFNADRHNSLDGVRQEMPDVTDAFVAAAWLVRDGQPQPPEAFGKLFDFNAERDRAFWGINRAGQPMIGVSDGPVGSVQLGELLAKAGFRDAVMLDSGASTSLAYRGESLVGYIPRPVPHVVGLLPPPNQDFSGEGCSVAAIPSRE